MVSSRVDQTPSSGHQASPPTARGHIGWIVAGSLAAGLVAALLPVAAPFIPARKGALTGAVLCGFALGWAMSAVLSARLTGQPQRWAAAPALSHGTERPRPGAVRILRGQRARPCVAPALLASLTWMIIRARQQLESRTKRWLLYPVLAVLALLGGRRLPDAGLAVADAKAYPMPGQLIDVGGHQLHLNCTGSGNPTEVLEPGGGQTSSNMGWITPTVVLNNRVCVYDRTGHGWSEPADTPQDDTQIATDGKRRCATHAAKEYSWTLNALTC